MEFFSQHNTASAAWSKKALLPCGLALLAVLGLVATVIWNQSDKKNAKASSKTSGPLLITPAQQHLGKLNQFEKKHFSFTIKNQGNEPLRIVKVEHSCGCTEAKASKEVIAPGETAKISGTLDAENRVGEFGSQIAVTYKQGSNDTVLNVLFKVGAKAVTVLNIPSQLDLGSTLLGQLGQTQTFELTRGEADLKWDTIKVVSTKTKAVTKKVSETKWNLIVTPPLGDVIGTYRDDISLVLTNQAAVIEKISLPATWKTTSENFSVSPNGVYLSGQKIARVTIRSLKGKTLQVSNVDLPQGAPVEVKTIEQDGKTVLEIKPFLTRGQLKQEPWSGKIQLTLTDGFVGEKCWIQLIK